jgi:hypothetical protein
MTETFTVYGRLRFVFLIKLGVRISFKIILLIYLSASTHTSQEKNWRFNLFKDLKSSNNQDLLFIYSTLSVTYSTGHLSTCQTVQKLMSMIQKEYNVLQTTLRFICLKIINICSLLHNDSYYSRFSIDKMDASPSQFFDTAMRHNSKTHWH